MQSFRYVAYDADGRRKKGVLIAESDRAASQQLQKEGLVVAEISLGNRSIFKRNGTKLDTDERAIFSRQMAVLLAAELPVENALDAVIESEGSRAMQSFGSELKAAILDGFPLSDAIEKGRAGFAPFYTSALRAGENSGDIALVFESLAEFLEAQSANRRDIATALIYPAFVGIVSMLVCFVLVTSVAPEVVAMFDVSGQPLPGLTVAVLASTDWITTPET